MSGEGGVGGRLGEHIGRVRGEHAGIGARRDIDVVEAHRVVGHDLELWPGRREELGVDLLREHGHDRVAALDHREQLVAWDAKIVLVHGDVAPLLQASHRCIHDRTGHEHVGSVGHELPLLCG